ncbi:MAG: hypothetical protein WCA63_04580, partial [Gallionella sp.]
AAPTFADANSVQMQTMQNKINALQDQLNQLTSGLANQSSNDTGLPMHGFMDVGYALNSQVSVIAYPNVANWSHDLFYGRNSFHCRIGWSSAANAGKGLFATFLFYTYRVDYHDRHRLPTGTRFTTIKPI